MTDKEEYLMTRLAMLLDGSIEALDAAAEREKRREAGKPMREVTEQQRAQMAREVVAEAFAHLGIEP